MSWQRHLGIRGDNETPLLQPAADGKRTLQQHILHNLIQYHGSPCIILASLHHILSGADTTVCCVVDQWWIPVGSLWASLRGSEIACEVQVVAEILNEMINLKA